MISRYAQNNSIDLENIKVLRIGCSLGGIENTWPGIQYNTKPSQLLFTIHKIQCHAKEIPSLDSFDRG